MAWTPDPHTTFGQAEQYFTGYRKFMQKNAPDLLGKYASEPYADGAKKLAAELGVTFGPDNAAMDDLRQIMQAVEADLVG